MDYRELQLKDLAHQRYFIELLQKNRPYAMKLLEEISNDIICDEKELMLEYIRNAFPEDNGIQEPNDDNGPM